MAFRKSLTVHEKTKRDLAMAGAVLLALAAEAHAQQQAEIVLATTTSVRDAGLLQHILPRFEAGSGYRVKVLAVGSGRAMELGRKGEADVLILHDPAGETRFVADSFGIERAPLMYNHFVLIGPSGDPAGVSGAGNVREALAAIARTGALFVSRGDRSGTHVKEMELWRMARVEPRPVWYRETGQGMGATLQIAHELQAYTIVDIATFLGHEGPLELAVLMDNREELANPYHVVVANQRRFEWVNVDGARALSAFLLSPATQRAIVEFRRDVFGRSLFLTGAIDRQIN